MRYYANQYFKKSRHLRQLASSSATCGLLVAALSTAAPTFAEAAENANATADQAVTEQTVTEQVVTELDKIVVTPTRTETTAGTNVQIITAADIDRIKPADLPTLLQAQPGVTVASNGPFGKLSSIFLNGAKNKHAVILLDGIRIGAATDGRPSIEFINVDTIERIEIVRGPYSTLYGSDAIGGVIQIFTRRTDGGEFTLSAGSYNSSKAVVSAGKRYSDANSGNAIDATITVGAQTTNGIDARTTAANEDDQDGFDNQFLAALVEANLATDTDITFSYRQSRGETEYDGFFNNDTFDNELLNVSISQAISEDVSVSLQAGESIDNRLSSNPDGSFTFLADTKRRSTSLLTEWAITRQHTLLGGIDYRDDEVDEAGGYEEDSRYERAGFAEYLFGNNQHDLQLGLRYTDNEQFGSATTGRIGWDWRFGSVMGLSVAVGNAFSAPTFNDLYFPFGSNPDLEAEDSRTVQVGLNGELLQQTLFWNLQAYYTDYDDFIELDNNFVPQNIEHVISRGVDLAVSFEQQHFIISSAIGWQLSENTDTNERLIRRPRWYGRLDADYKHSFNIAGSDIAWSIGMSLIGQTGSLDEVGFPTTRVELPGYGLLNLRQSIQLFPELGVQFLVNNVFDKDDYANVATYNEPDRNYRVAFDITID